ncbi:MAG: bacterio-opsin activator domain-containing protein [Halobellus sp.]
MRVLYAGDSLPSGPSAADVADADARLSVDRVTDPTTARERVSGGSVDCVVATHQEGGFDGLAVLEAIRRDHADFPVVLVPEEVDDTVARRAVAADATALVPADGDDAVEAVAEAVGDAVSTAADGSRTRMPVSDLPEDAERRLKERALDEAPVGITISDATRPDNPIIYVNDCFREMTGYEPQEAIGRNHRFLQGPETDPERVAELAEGIAEKRQTRVVLRNYTADGALFWNQVDVAPIFRDGEVTHYVGFQMDVTERERTKRRLAEEREALDRLLDRLQGLSTDVTAALVQADSRAEVEEQIVERIAEGDEYAAAWLGRYDAVEEAVSADLLASEGGDVIASEEGERSVSVHGDAPGVRALADAIENQETAVVDDAGGLPKAGAGERCLLVPLAYRSTTYGVLAVFDDEDFLDYREEALLGALGQSIGTTINDLLTKQTLASDTALTIEAEVHGDLPLVDMAAALDCELEDEATATDDGSILLLASTDHDDPETVLAAAEGTEGVAAAEILVADEKGCVVQLRLSSSPLETLLIGTTGRLTGLRTEGTALRLTFQVGTEQAARRLLKELRERYERVELLAYHESTEPAQTARGFRDELRSRLTDRQLEALQKAYVSGFFEWPRRADGDQLAESMGIVPSTYHQHLQAAKRKLVEAFFEE